MVKIVIVVITKLTKFYSSSNKSCFSLGSKNQNERNTIAVIRLNKLSLNEDASNIVTTTMKERIQIKNAASVYQFVNLFNVPSLQKAILRFIESCFTIISDTDNFKQLEYASISKIFASSSLFITTEVEVFKVAERWLNYNIFCKKHIFCISNI